MLCLSYQLLTMSILETYFFLYFPNFSHSKTEKDSVKTANTACHVILNDNVINVSGLYITPSW